MISKYENLIILDCIWYENLGLVKCKNMLNGEISFYVGMGERYDMDEDNVSFDDYNITWTPSEELWKRMMKEKYGIVFDKSEEW